MRTWIAIIIGSSFAGLAASSEAVAGALPGQAVPPAVEVHPYATIGVVVLMVGAVAVGMLLVAHLIGPTRRGPVKDSAYESGMPPLQDTRRRFNVRFYIVAVLFLLFDVEIIFLWPWATLFHQTAVTDGAIPLQGGGVAGPEFLLVGMGIFFLLLVFGLVYEWKKGAFQWE